MREILFRGKRYNGEWLAGDLLANKYERPNICPIGDVNCYPVIPETVGQYTGMKDEYGRKIFEGDVVEFYFYDKVRHKGKLVDVKNTKTMLIEWGDCGFHMVELFRNYRYEKDFGIAIGKIYTYRGNKKQGVYKSNHCYFVELVGNKFDNPELLKGEENE